jgi:hypothetical protein
VSGWLLDTNVLSELRRPRRDPHVVAWVDAQRAESLFVSRVTLAELRYGIESLPAEDERRRALGAWLARTIRPWFGPRVLELDEDVLVRWRRIVRAARERGHTPPMPDVFIAATAEVHRLRVVTRNVADFLPLGVPVLNPWDPPA